MKSLDTEADETKSKSVIWYVYILLCSNHSYYTGITTDVEKRYQLHLSSMGAKYTRSFSPVKVMYVREFASKSEAGKRESEIKSWSRDNKEKLINDEC